MVSFLVTSEEEVRLPPNTKKIKLRGAALECIRVLLIFKSPSFPSLLLFVSFSVWLAARVGLE